MVANPVLGDVDFEVDDKVYTLRCGTLALAVLESETGMPAAQYFKKPIDQWGVKDLRDVFIAMMARHHPKMTENDVCDIIDSIGLEKAGELITRALLTSNTTKSGGGSGGDGNPPDGSGTP